MGTVHKVMQIQEKVPFKHVNIQLWLQNKLGATYVTLQ